VETELELRRVIEALRNSEGVREVLRQKSDLVGSVAHELRTPLTALQMRIELMERAGVEGLLPHALRRHFAIVKQSAERLRLRLEQIFDAHRGARADEASLTLARTSIDLKAAAKTAVDALETVAHEAGVALVLTGDDGVVGTWDVERLDQIVSNLVGNALHFGRGHPVTVRVARQDRWALLTVTDEGPGIAPADCERIFGMYERGLGSTSSGLGLGLWIARRAAEALGGSIDVESAPGRGATFHVRLPL
jgi:signal transduction histidine kinase